MTILDLWKLIKKMWYLLIICPVVVGAAATAFSWFALEDEYTASSSIIVMANTASGGEVTVGDLETTKSLSITNDVVAISGNEAITDAVSDKLGLSNLNGYQIKVTPENQSRVVHISVTSPDPVMSAKVSNALAEQLVTASVEVLDVEMVNVVEEAKAPLDPSGPNRKLYVLVGLLAGIALALVIMCVRDMMDSSVRDAEDASETFGQAVMSTLPAVSAAEGGSKTGKKNAKGKSEIPDSFEITALKNPCDTLLANIRFASLDRKVTSIVVTSSVPDEGKSTTSANLALSMAKSGKRVLLIDADMRRKSLAGRLKVNTKQGLFGILAGECSVSDAIVPTKWENLFFLDAESGVPNPSNMFSSERFAMLLDMLEDVFDYVVLDTPPLAAFIDAAVAGGVADGVLLVVREGSTSKKAVASALSQLEAAEAKVLGLVLTFSKKQDSAYYYSKYYYNDRGERIKGRHS